MRKRLLNFIKGLYRKIYPMTKKQIIADRAWRLGDLALSIYNQMLKARVSGRERFFIDLLRRQAVLLHDASRMLKANNEFTLDTTFIAFRCLLDDFIALLYIIHVVDDTHIGQQGVFVIPDDVGGHLVLKVDEERIIEHHADNLKQKFSMIKASQGINEKFFNEHPLVDLATAQYYQNEFNEFRADANNQIYFEDFANEQWKKFPSTTKIFSELELNMIGQASAHSYVVWKLLSNYVHFSVVVAKFTADSRAIEIDQLGEVLSYCFKTVVFSSSALKCFGFNHTIDDPTNVMKEIFDGYGNP